jgi:hypothetical protein
MKAFLEKLFYVFSGVLMVYFEIKDQIKIFGEIVKN